MNLSLQTKRSIALWQFLFILLSTTWLWAPHLNHLLSYRTALISQYEAVNQPFSWLFRLCDVLGASLLISVAASQLGKVKKKLASYILLIIGIGFLIDPLRPVSCHVIALSCQENFSFSFLAHAIFTVITSLAIFSIGIYDAWLRRRLVSIGFVVFQLVYFGLFLSQLANQDQFNTFSQYLYQLVSIIWIAWYCRDFLVNVDDVKQNSTKISAVRISVAIWAFINGLLAIILSLAHLSLLGKINGVYFAGNNAWLAQHGVVIGVILLYLSRHLARGEMRARQIFLFIVGFETLKYSVLSPSLPLMIIYFVTFCALFVLHEGFDR